MEHRCCCSRPGVISPPLCCLSDWCRSLRKQMEWCWRWTHLKLPQCSILHRTVQVGENRQNEQKVETFYFKWAPLTWRIVYEEHLAPAGWTRMSWIIPYSRFSKVPVFLLIIMLSMFWCVMHLDQWTKVTILVVGNMKKICQLWQFWCYRRWTWIDGTFVVYIIVLARCGC